MATTSENKKASVVCDLLTMVGVSVNFYDVLEWKTELILAAEKWARRELEYASDHKVKRLTCPVFLARRIPGYGGYAPPPPGVSEKAEPAPMMPRCACERCSAMLRPLMVFAAEMLNKLHQNHRKGDQEGWRNNSFVSLMNMMRAEVEELHLEIIRDFSPDRCMREAADVANIAMMIHDVCVMIKESGVMEPPCKYSKMEDRSKTLSPDELANEAR